MMDAGSDYLENFKRLPAFQKASLLSILFLVILLPIGIILALGPVKLFPKAGQGPIAPITPVIPPGSGGSVEVSLTPQTTSVRSGSFLMNVQIDTKGKSVTAAEIRLRFDPHFLQVDNISFTNAPQPDGTHANAVLPVTLEQPSIDNTTGTVSFTVGVNPGQPLVGNGMLASIGLSSNSIGTSNVSFDAATRGTAMGETENVITVLNNATVEVQRAPSPVPSPEATPSASPTPSPVANRRVDVMLGVQSTAVLLNEEFDVDVRLINRGMLGMSAAEIHLGFDPNYLEALRVNFYDYSMMSNVLSETRIDNNNGGVTFTIGARPGVPVTSGSTPATVRFKAKGNSGLSQIRILDSTQVAVVESGNSVVGDRGSTEINVGKTRNTILALAVKLGGVSRHLADKRFDITLDPTGSVGNRIITTEQVMMRSDETGVYKFDFGASTYNGSYDIYAKTRSHLRGKIGSIKRIVSGENIIDGTHTPLIPGDIVDDNKIDLDDFTTLVEDFGSRMPATGSLADLDYDGDVDIDDYNMFVENYGKQGD